MMMATEVHDVLILPTDATVTNEALRNDTGQQPKLKGSL